jgi:hypothetical protein
MDPIKEHVRIYIKQSSLAALNIDKIHIIPAYGYHKIFHNGDFICHLNTTDNAWMTKLNSSINNYNNLLKKKVTFCVLCITNSDPYIIDYVVKSLSKLQYMKVILIAQNDAYIKLANSLNIDYIISSRNDYKNMIQNGLTYIKNSNIKNTKIFITNTETLIDTTILSRNFSKFNGMHNFFGPSQLKYIDMANLTTHNINATGNLFLPNWFMINNLNFNIFEGTSDLLATLEIHIAKHKVLTTIDSMSMCFNYFRSPKMKQSEKTLEYNQIEYDLLMGFLKNAPERYKKFIEYSKTLTIKIPENGPMEIDVTKEKKTETPVKFYNTPIIQNTIIKKPEYKGYKQNVDKIYFLNNFLDRTELLTKLSKFLPNITKYSIIDGNKNRNIAHLTALKDALTRKFAKVAIIEDKLISNEFFNILGKPEYYSHPWTLLLFVSLTAENKIVRLFKENVSVNQIGFFAYCVKNSVLKNMVDILSRKNNLADTIIDLQSNEQIYAIYDNFDIYNMGINRTGKAIVETKKKQIFRESPIITVQTIQPVEQRPITHRNYITPTFTQEPRQIITKTPVIPTLITSVIKPHSTLIQPPIIHPQTSNKIVQGLWIGEGLDLNEILCIMSFIYNGHEFHLYTYEPVKNIPKECHVKDANEILPASDIFYYSETQSISGQKRPTGFSNMFRYKLLYDKGGYWVDMDMICIKPLRFSEPYVFSSESTFGRNQTINAGIIKCPKGCDFAKYCYTISKGKDKTKIKWGEIGPKLVGEAVTKYNLTGYVKPWYYFCPIG